MRHDLLIKQVSIVSLFTFFYRLNDITKEDLIEIDTICPICLNELSPGNGKKISCGHIFHLNCLKFQLNLFMLFNKKLDLGELKH